MERFKLSEKAVKALEETITDCWGDTTEETMANLYGMIADALINITMFKADGDGIIISESGHAMFAFKSILDDIFKK